MYSAYAPFGMQTHHTPTVVKHLNIKPINKDQ